MDNIVILKKTDLDEVVNHLLNMRKEQEDEPMNLEKAAEFLGISTVRLSELVKIKKVPCIHDARTYLFSKNALLNAMSNSGG